MTAVVPSIILVIDNDRTTGCALKHMAAEAFPDFQTLWAKNGLIGLALAQQHAIHLRLVVLDVHMPILDGRLAAAQIRALAPNVPIIPLTSDAKCFPLFLELGCVEPVHKHPSELVTMPERMAQAMDMIVPPIPNVPWVTMAQEQARALMAFVNGAQPAIEAHESLAAMPQLDERLNQIVTRLERYCERFPHPAREVTQALKELREVLK